MLAFKNISKAVLVLSFLAALLVLPLLWAMLGDWIMLIGIIACIAFLTGFGDEHRRGPNDPDSLAGGGETGGGDSGG